jgi:hypothetical protein
VEFHSEANLNPSVTSEELVEGGGLPESKLWFNELVELEPTEKKVNKRRRRRSPNGNGEGPSMADTLDHDLGEIVL